ncbi:enoyl-CoA hydratase [Streptococcus sp. Marseille-Q0941]|uniref:enoyl-CoA hydratase n=1 Tax=Streptococcus sp. Marseille-Q0941 TaxID=2942206 RepID=UPI002072F6F1|nr:enoyl-CoA hydratase [Streptococcus sp. Marseille-Q0941]
MNHIIFQIQDDLATITLNRPDVANGFHIPMCEEIIEALELAEKDASVSFILINAMGKVFSVGGDLVEMKRAVDEDDIDSLARIAELVNTISYKIKQIPKPIIMEVDGAVAGAAANMALAVDFCIASDKAKFIQAFVGVGLAPDAGGLFLLTRSLGATRATQLAMTGEAFTAEKAMEAGALYRLCISEQLEKTREQLLKKLRRGSTNSYAAIKKLVWESEFKQWNAYAQLELELQKSLSYTEDFKEGVRAHSERRRPKFVGK